MYWTIPDETWSVVTNIAVGVVSGLIILGSQFLWRKRQRLKRRGETVTALRRFFKDWEEGVGNLAYDENTQFIFHEQMIRRMNDNLFFTRSDLPGNKWSSIAELTRAHEEYIDSRRRVLTGLFDVPPQERHILLPDEFREFFAQAKAIEWLNLEGEPR